MTTMIENVKVLFLLYLALKKEFVKAISIKKERILKIIIMYLVKNLDILFQILFYNVSIVELYIIDHFYIIFV